MSVKKDFENNLQKFVRKLGKHISTSDGQWTIKDFIDVYKNIYTISANTKIVSKILEIHLFPELLNFAKSSGYNIVLADYQNYYPDLTFINKENTDIKFAVDLKTTYRNPKNPNQCNGFT